MKKVYVFLAEGFEEMEAATPVDLLRRVNVDAKFVSVTGEKTVCGAHGITFTADLLFEEIEDDADMLVLPGGMPGTTNLMAHEGLSELLTKQYNDRKWVAAICAAPMVLGALGIVMGRWATIYPGMEEYLVGADISSEEVCVSGNVITSKAPGTAIPFALKLIEVLVSESYAEHIKKEIVYQQG
ncbi:MAG: DJ-1/PfpI family protein [Bacillota bacterium]|nr:DJ-1/PfpI family protein [Bacillota bacterium]